MENEKPFSIINYQLSIEYRGLGVGAMSGITEVSPKYLAVAETASVAIPAGYKQTEVGVVPEDWDVCELQDAVNFLDGLRRPVKSGDRVKISGIYPYYGASGIVDYVNDYIFDDELILLGEDGENILSRNLPLAFKVSGKIWVNNHAHVMKPNEYFDITYLTEFLESLDYSLLNSGTAQPKLNKQACLRIKVAKPPRKEQTAIANALSDVDALISELEKLIAKKQAIKTATMQQLLTGRTRLPQFALREDGTPKGTKPSELGEIPEDWAVFSLLDIANLLHGKAHEPYVAESGKYVVVNSKFVSTNGKVRKYCSQNDCAAKKGDILMVLSDLPNGKALAKCFYADQDEVYAVNQRVCIFRTSVFDSKYLQLILNRHKYFLALDDGVTQTHILNGDIAACQLFAPFNREEQTAIATILSDMDEEIQALEQRLGKTRHIKQGMMQELLTGKTRLMNA
jgi:type I restriction enzyme S subunit